MQWLLVITAILLATVTCWDLFITVFSPAGAGPLTRFWTRPLWSCLLWIHDRRPMHRLLSLVGPFILVVSILLWYTLLGLSLLLALAAFSDPVVNSTTREAATLLEKFYFVSTTISSLGYGDLVPARFPWTIISTVATLFGSIIITISLSYVLSVLSSAVERRTLAKSIFGLGVNSMEIIERSKLHDPRDSLKDFLLSLSSEIDEQALKQLAYPVLKFFHSADVEAVPARGLLLLADSLFLLDNLPEDRRPPVGVSQLLWSSIGNYAQLRHAKITSVRDGDDSCPRSLLESARQLDMSPNQSEHFKHAWQEYRSLRTLLVTLCREEGWAVQDDLSARS